MEHCPAPTHNYVGMSTAASTGGVMQVRVVLLSTAQGDCKQGGGGGGGST